MKRVIKTFFLLCLSIFMMATPLSAFAEEASPNEQKPLDYSGVIKKEVEKSFQKIGVEKSKIPVLVEKMERGEALDSMKKEYENLKPQIKEGGYEKTIYPDGSVKVSAIRDITMNSLKGMGAGDGRLQTSSAYIDYGFVGIYYEVTYRQSRATNEAQILSVQNFSVRTAGGTYSVEKPNGEHHLYGWRNPTHAWYAIRMKIHNSRTQRRYWLKFYANGSRSWIDHN